MKKSKVYNFLKTSQAEDFSLTNDDDFGLDNFDFAEDDFAMDDLDDQGFEDQSQGLYTLSSLIAALDQDPEGTMLSLRNMISDSQTIEVDGRQVDALEILDPSRWQGLRDEKEKGEIAGIIMELLPDNFKEQEENVLDPTLEVPVESKDITISSQVDKSIQELQKLAQKVASPKSKSYNFIKSAQRVAQHSILYGPDSTRPAPTVNQAMNLGEIIERNKGWGKNVSKWWNVDYEMFWRQNVMDKYYAPFKDKDGNWVGGYLEKRFETDRNVSDLNNLQLKPGERAKPRPKELGLIEARIQDARDKGFLQNSEEKAVKTASFNLKKKRQ